MPIYTPRGLKIRFEPSYAFGLMARLEPEVRPFRVLQTVEAIENAPSAFALLAALGAVVAGQSPTSIAIWTAAAGIVVAALTRHGLFIVPGLIALSGAFSRVHGFGLMFIPFAVLAWYLVGWQAIVAYVIGRAVAGVLNGLLEMLRARFYYREIGHPLSGAEANFLSAYRLHAQALGRSLNLETSEEEQGELAASCLARFAYEWPEVARRYS